MKLKMLLAVLVATFTGSLTPTSRADVYQIDTQSSGFNYNYYFTTPSTCSFYTTVTCTTGMAWNDGGGYYTYSVSTLSMGIYSNSSYPPLVYSMSVVSPGSGGNSTDFRQVSGKPAGNYQMYYGGGAGTDGWVHAYTEVTW